MQPEQRRSPFLGHELTEQGVEAICKGELRVMYARRSFEKMFWEDCRYYF